MLGIFAAFLMSAEFFFFSKSLFRKIISGTDLPSKCETSLDPDQVRSSIGHNLSPTCLQRLSEDGTSRLRINSLQSE